MNPGLGGRLEQVGQIDGPARQHRGPQPGHVLDRGHGREQEGGDARAARPLGQLPEPQVGAGRHQADEHVAPAQAGRLQPPAPQLGQPLEVLGRVAHGQTRLHQPVDGLVDGLEHALVQGGHPAEQAGDSQPEGQAPVAAAADAGPVWAQDERCGILDLVELGEGQAGQVVDAVHRRGRHPGLVETFLPERGVGVGLVPDLVDQGPLLLGPDARGTLPVAEHGRTLPAVRCPTARPYVIASAADGTLKAW